MPAGGMFDPFGRSYYPMNFIDASTEKISVPDGSSGVIYWVGPEGNQAVLALVAPGKAEPDSTLDLKSLTQFIPGVKNWVSRIQATWFLTKPELEEEIAQGPPKRVVEVEDLGSTLRFTSRTAPMALSITFSGIDYSDTVDGYYLLVPHDTQVEVKSEFFTGPAEPVEWAYLYWRDGNGEFVRLNGASVFHRYTPGWHYKMALIVSFGGAIEQLPLPVAEVFEDARAVPRSTPRISAPVTGIPPLDTILRDLTKIED